MDQWGHPVCVGDRSVVEGAGEEGERLEVILVAVPVEDVVLGVVRGEDAE